MAPIDSTTWRAGRRALERALSFYLDDPNVTLVDLGFRMRTSAPNGFTPELAVRIHVRNELSNEARDELAAEASLRLGFAVEIIAANYGLHLRRDAPEQLICKIAAANGAIIPQLGMRVIKFSGGASETCGIIAGVLGYRIQQNGGTKHLAGPLIHIMPDEPDEKICGFGDSGAWWVEASTRRAVALHFAGSHDPSFALAFPMPEVLEALEVEIVAAPENSSWQSTETRTHVVAPHAVKTIPIAISSPIPNRAEKRAYQIARAGLLLALGVMIAGFYLHRQYVHRQQQKQILQLHGQLQHLKTIAQVDSARQQHIRRIAAIIDRFNRKMESKLKFRIAVEIYEMSLKYSRLDVELICATITHESGRTWNPEAISPAGALGLMQILPSTGIYLAKAEGLAWTSAESILFDPIYNLRLGCRYLDELVSTYGVEAGLAAYNGGDRQAKLWLQGGRAKQLLHAETAYYVPAVLRIYEEYRRTAM